MKTWQYSVVWNEELRDAGIDGWEAVSVLGMPTPDGRFEVLMKRYMGNPAARKSPRRALATWTTVDPLPADPEERKQRAQENARKWFGSPERSE